MNRTYSELKKFDTFEDRFKYLLLGGEVGKETFGFERYLNQVFYSKKNEWRIVRNYVISRDLGMDLGLDGYPINGFVYVHHLNPITPRDILDREDWILDPEFLICCSHATHNAIHYGDLSFLDSIKVVERRPNDTCPWRK